MDDDNSQDNEESVESLEYLLRRSLVSRNKQTIILKGPDGSTVFCCVECPMKYEDKESMELHLCMHNKEYRFICTVCGTGLKRKEHLERHMLGHQEVRPHACEDCGKAFKRKEHLTIHKAIHTGQKDMQCRLCDRSFHRKDHLRKHMQAHTNKFRRQGLMVSGEIKEEVMDDNSMESFEDPDFSQDDEAEMDMQQQQPVDPERPFSCVMCPKTYKRKDHLKLHMKTHFKNSKKKVCPRCSEVCDTEEQLLFHIQEFHIDKVEPQEEEDTPKPAKIPKLKWQPPIMPENKLLIIREPVHEVRPHECQVCHKRFKRKQHLNVHFNVHTKKDMSIWCSLCNEGFNTNMDFERHKCSGQKYESSENSFEYLDEQFADQTELAEPDYNGMPDQFNGLSDQFNGASDQFNGASDQFNGASDQYNGVPENMVEVIQTMDMQPGLSEMITSDSDVPVPTPQKVFVCKFCLKPFKRRDHYKIHLNIHTGHKSFFCPDCGKGFYRKDHLQKHLLVHNKSKKVKKEIPELFPISLLNQKKKSILPEITIHAPSNSNLRIPLNMKVPYEVVTSTGNGEKRSVVHPIQGHGILS